MIAKEGSLRVRRRKETPAGKGRGECQEAGRGVATPPVDHAAARRTTKKIERARNYHAHRLDDHRASCGTARPCSPASAHRIREHVTALGISELPAPLVLATVTPFVRKRIACEGAAQAAPSQALP